MEEKIIIQALAAFRPNISSLKLHTLIKLAGSCERAWTIPDETLEQYGWNNEQRHLFNEFRKYYFPEKELQRLSENGINFISINDDQYPTSLKNIFDPPLGLYVRGRLEEKPLNISFVGSRRATPYGKTVTNMLVRPLAAKGAVIISGLAYGIDAEAHLACMHSGGITWAVIGNGCDEQTLYPRAHRQLARDIIKTGGAIISEYPPTTRPQQYFFPQRNRIIAGLSRAVVVVEASKKSGALITARLGLEQNKDVFSVPGPITSELSQGTNELIREGAIPVQSAEQIIESLELFSVIGNNNIKHVDIRPLQNAVIETPNCAEPEKKEPQNDNEKILLSLSQNPLPIDEIVKISTLPSHTVAATLTILEIDGCVKDVGGKNYVRI